MKDKDRTMKIKFMMAVVLIFTSLCLLFLGEKGDALTIVIALILSAIGLKLFMSYGWYLHDETNKFNKW